VASPFELLDDLVAEAIFDDRLTGSPGARPE
jgi:hypothetical protein